MLTKVPEHPSVQSSLLSGVISLTHILDSLLIFFSLIFTFFVENHLLGNTKHSLLILWFKSYRPSCRERALHFSLFLHSLLKITGEHKTEFLCLMVEELQVLQAKGLIFLIIFGFFVESHLLENKKLSFLVSWLKSYIVCPSVTLLSGAYL